MARNLLKYAIGAGLLLLATCRTIPYNPVTTIDNSQLIPFHGVYVPKGDKKMIEDITYTIEGIRNGDIKVHRVETGNGQWEYFLDGGIYEWRPLSKEEQADLGIVVKDGAAINGGKDLLTVEEARSELSLTERLYAGLDREKAKEKTRLELNNTQKKQ